MNVLWFDLMNNDVVFSPALTNSNHYSVGIIILTEVIYQLLHDVETSDRSPYYRIICKLLIPYKRVSNSKETSYYVISNLLWDLQELLYF